MTTYSDYEQRQLDIATSAAMDRRDEARRIAMRTIQLSTSQLAITEQALSVYIEQLAQHQRESTYSAILDEHRKTALAVRQILREANAKEK